MWLWQYYWEKTSSRIVLKHGLTFRVFWLDFFSAYYNKLIFEKKRLNLDAYFKNKKDFKMHLARRRSEQTRVYRLRLHRHR